MPSTYEQFSRRRHRFLAAGKCAYCGREPYKAGGTICQHHREIKAAGTKRRRMRLMAEGVRNGKPLCERCLRPKDEYSITIGYRKCMGCHDIEVEARRISRLRKGL